MNLSSVVHWIAVNHSSLLALVGGGGALSVALETVLTHWHVNSKKVAFFLLNTVTTLTSLSTYFLGASGKQAAGTFAGLTILAQFWHRFVVSDANAKYVTPFLNYLSNQKTTSTPSVTVSNSTQTSSTAYVSPTVPQVQTVDLTTIGK